MPDITILSWITAEVDQALDRVRTELASYSAPPHDAAALARCPEHLHQVSGALNMVGLSGATRFCAALENSFARLDASTAANAVLVDNAVLELKQFVDDLANGQPDVAMRLYPAYRDLALVQGRVDCSEVELFFPDLTPAAPAHPSPKSLEKKELASFLQAQRTRWQRGILAWLRRQSNGLEEMRDALEEIHSVAHALPERRALWWVAGGVVDALLDVTEPGELAQARRLWNKIDLYTRDLGTGAATDNEALLRELLYVVAGCAPLTQRIRDIKLLYGLDTLRPAAQPAGEAAAPDPDTLQTLVGEVREKLRKLRKFWRQYMVGDSGAGKTFAERVRTLQAKAAPLASPHLEALLESGQPGGAALEGTGAAALALRISGGPDAFQVEAGLDLVTLLEPVGGQSAEPGSNVALVRFFANGRAVVAFCAALLEEFARFPTDPSRVSPGEPG